MTEQQLDKLKDACNKIKTHNPCDGEYNKLVDAIDNKDAEAFLKVLRTNRSWLAARRLTHLIQECNFNVITDADVGSDLEYLTLHGYELSEYEAYRNDKQLLEIEGISINWDGCVDEDDIQSEKEQIKDTINDYIITLANDIREKLELKEYTEEEIPLVMSDEYSYLASLYAYYQELKYVEDECGNYFELAPEEYYDEDWAYDWVVDCGYLLDSFPYWITNAIDWNYVRNALLEDYSDVTIAGKTFFWRER